MRAGGITLVAVIALACSTAPLRTVDDGVMLLEQIAPVGAEIRSVRAALRERDLAFSEFPPADCRGFIFSPVYSCKGGPALWVTLDEGIRPWSPFYDPSLQAFIAFDQSSRVAFTACALEGGDF